MRSNDFFWIIPFCMFLGGYIGASFFFHTPSFPMPLLLGTSIHQSLAILSERNLNTRIIAYTVNADLQEGTIVQQIPAADEKIKAHQSVFLVLSEKPARQGAPLFLKKDLATITANSEKQGIRLEIHYIAHEYPHHQCFAQSPTQGEPLETAGMSLYLAKEKRQYLIWPNFIGKSAKEVIEFLEDHAIIPTIVEVPCFWRRHQRTVIDQQPIAGTILCIDPQAPPFVQLKVE